MKRIILIVFVSSCMMNTADNNDQKRDVSFYKQEIIKLDSQLKELKYSSREWDEFVSYHASNHAGLYEKESFLRQNYYALMRSRTRIPQTTTPAQLDGAENTLDEIKARIDYELKREFLKKFESKK